MFRACDLLLCIAQLFVHVAIFSPPTPSSEFELSSSDPLLRAWEETPHPAPHCPGPLRAARSPLPLINVPFETMPRGAADAASREPALAAGCSMLDAGLVSCFYSGREQLGSASCLHASHRFP